MEELKRRIGDGGVQRSTKEEQTSTVLLNLTRLHYYYNIYLIETLGQQSGRLLNTHHSLQSKLAGRGSDTMTNYHGIYIGKGEKQD